MLFPPPPFRGVIDELNAATSSAYALTFEGATCPDIGEVTEADFNAGLKGSPGEEELKLGLTACAAADDGLKEFLRERVMPGAGQ